MPVLGSRGDGTKRPTAPNPDVHDFSHRYDIEPDGAGSTIAYTETIERANYTPYWLHALVRPIFRPLVNRADRKQLQNLARLAEERANG